MSLFATAERIDPAAAWDRLPPDAQRAFGIAAITMVVSERAWDLYDARSSVIAPPAIEEALERGREEMDNVVREHVIPNLADDALLIIDTPAIGFATCRACGCSERNACEGGCGWHDETLTLCSTCARGQLQCEAINA